MIRQDENGRPRAIIRYNTDEGTYVASAIHTCREMLKNQKVKAAFKQLTADFAATLETWYKDEPKDKVVDFFINKIMEHFPLVFVDHSLTSPAYKACHWRRAGAKGYDFDPRKQSIVINGVASRNGRNLASSRTE